MAKSSNPAIVALCMTLELKCWRCFYRGTSVHKYRVRKQEGVCIKLWKELPLPGMPVFLFCLQHRPRHDATLKARLSCLTHFIYYYSKTSPKLLGCTHACVPALSCRSQTPSEQDIIYFLFYVFIESWLNLKFV